MASYAYGKGAIGVHQYWGIINGDKYAKINLDKFKDFFEKSVNLKGRYFTQDNNPPQNSQVSNEAFEQVKAFLFKIPPQSPNVNPIRKIFYLASKQIRLDPKNQGMKKENFIQFCHRCRKVLLDFPGDIIDKAVTSMDKDIQMVIKNQDQRTKY